jgi:hypothetical protein
MAGCGDTRIRAVGLASDEATDRHRHDLGVGAPRGCGRFLDDRTDGADLHHPFGPSRGWHHVPPPGAHATAILVVDVRTDWRGNCSCLVRDFAARPHAPIKSCEMDGGECPPCAFSRRRSGSRHRDGAICVLLQHRSDANSGPACVRMANHISPLVAHPLRSRRSCGGAPRGQSRTTSHATQPIPGLHGPERPIILM